MCRSCRSSSSASDPSHGLYPGNLKVRLTLVAVGEEEDVLREVILHKLEVVNSYV